MKKTRKGEVTFDTDEHVKPGTTVETLAKMRPAFKKDGGTVTAGNASGINDGAAFLVLADAGGGARARTRSRWRGWCRTRSPACRTTSWARARSRRRSSRWRRRAWGSTRSTSIESNEAFAAQAIAVARGLELDMKKINPNGGAIALGHPIGASGAVLAVKAIYELHRTGGRYALVTMCIGGGQGIAAVFERL